MEYKELKSLVKNTLLKTAATGLIGIVLTLGATKLVESKENKSTVAAGGLGLSTIACWYQICRGSKKTVGHFHGGWTDLSR